MENLHCINCGYEITPDNEFYLRTGKCGKCGQYVNSVKKRAHIAKKTSLMAACILAVGALLLLLVLFIPNPVGEKLAAWYNNENSNSWPEGSGYLTSFQNKPSLPYDVEPANGNIKITDATEDGRFQLQGEIEIRNSQMIIFFPGKEITHACKTKHQLEIPDYNDDKCVFLYGMTCKIDEYGQYRFVKYAPDELTAENKGKL